MKGGRKSSLTCYGSEGEVRGFEVKPLELRLLDEKDDLHDVEDDGDKRRKDGWRLEGLGHEHKGRHGIKVCGETSE